MFVAERGAVFGELAAVLWVRCPFVPFTNSWSKQTVVTELFPSASAPYQLLGCVLTCGA